MFVSCFFISIGSGNWNICVINLENLSQKQVTWIRYIFFLLAEKKKDLSILKYASGIR